MRLLDLFCGAGGAAMGYSRAGFDEIVGVDLTPQPHYPFQFIQADAMTYPLDGFDAIHASPPCQGYSVMRHLPSLRDRDYPKLIAPVLARLKAAGVPYVVENVDGAKYEMAAGWLCGQMFELPFYRHRRFATNWVWMAPGHPKHEGSWNHPINRTLENGLPRLTNLPPPTRSPLPKSKGQNGVTVLTSGARRPGSGYGHAAGIDLVRAAMQIDWMSRDEITQAIPPAYTEYLGRVLLGLL